MLKRIARDIGIIFGVVLLGFGYLWLKDLPERRRARKDAQEVLANLNVQADELKTLGAIDLDLNKLTFAELERQLHQPNLKKAGASNTTRVGWACADENCVILASFLTPFGKEIQPDAIPAALIVIAPIVNHYYNITVGGIALGDSEDRLLQSSKQRGFGSPKGHQKISWDNNWDVSWAEVDKRIGALVFLNKNLLPKSTDARQSVVPTAGK